jgi:hypothetical protein
LEWDEDNLMDYFKKIKVVTVSMSYEYDPLMFSEISVIS